MCYIGNLPFERLHTREDIGSLAAELCDKHTAAPAWRHRSVPSVLYPPKRDAIPWVCS